MTIWSRVTESSGQIFHLHNMRIELTMLVFISARSVTECLL